MKIGACDTLVAQCRQQVNRLDSFIEYFKESARFFFEKDSCNNDKQRFQLKKKFSLTN